MATHFGMKFGSIIYQWLLYIYIYVRKINEKVQDFDVSDFILILLFFSEVDYLPLDRRLLNVMMTVGRKDVFDVDISQMAFIYCLIMLKAVL